MAVASTIRPERDTLASQIQGMCGLGGGRGKCPDGFNEQNPPSCFWVILIFMGIPEQSGGNVEWSISSRMREKGVMDMIVMNIICCSSCPRGGKLFLDQPVSWNAWTSVMKGLYKRNNHEEDNTDHSK